MMSKQQFVHTAKRAAVCLGVALFLVLSAPTMPTAIAADAPAMKAPVVTPVALAARDRERDVQTLAAQLAQIGAELARVQSPGAAKPSLLQVRAGIGDAAPRALTENILAEVDALGDFETRIAANWNAEAKAMSADGIADEIVARQRVLLAEVLQRAAQFRHLVANLRSARNANAQALSAPLGDLAAWFAQQPTARGWRPITKNALPFKLARADTSLKPVVMASSGDVALSAVGDPPASDALAETLDVQFTPAIRDLAQSLGGQPVAIRNWVYNNIGFTPTFGSIQGAGLTLLSRRGNAFDIASLTLALLRCSGVPARYAKSVVQIPIKQAQNWLGNIATPQMAVDMMSKGGIPAAAVIAGGKIVAVRFEHVWVEAWVDFIPSRAAINRVPDQWVPFDVAFKQFDYAPKFDWRKHTLAARQQASADFIANIKVDASGGITGFDFDTLNHDMGSIASQLADDMHAVDPNVDQNVFRDERAIRPVDSLIIAGSLPYAIRSNTITRYNTLPSNLRQSAEVEFFADSFSLSANSPSQTASVPLVQLGTQRFGVEYVGASPADTAALASYAASGAASLPVGQINVIAQLKLGDKVLFQSGSTRMGTPHYWHVNIRDAQGHTTTTQAYNFAAGSPIIFSADLAGVTPERVEREGAGLPDVAMLPQREALYYAGLLYWAMTDHLRDQAARSLGGYQLRLPSIGAFAQPYQVSYFFGIPRSGYVNGHVSDVKVERIGIGVPKPDDMQRLALHAGSFGSMAESATWSLLRGSTASGLGMSATTALKLAVDSGQRIFQIDSSNLATAMAQLQLSSFAENEIRQSVLAGMVVIAPEREVHYKGWSGSGYVVFDPDTGSSLQRVEGGFAGGINIGCVARAVSLKILCHLKFIAKFKQIIFELGEKFLARITKMAGIDALLALVAPEVAVVLPIIMGVMTAIAVIQATYEVLTWVREIEASLRDLTPEERKNVGISAYTAIASS
ncbi:MAG: transglutaminase-like domain-containing protein, partial [Xanthomonadales bacterium]|nr:transglutaminase-like domain-containing protein [Xanthomonadales bacterium]